ncbi:hypothetical protein N9L19_01170 [bacterium]|nr:hypothetical protein [bacterium]
MAMMVGVDRMVPETMPPYLDKSTLVLEQEVARVKVGSGRHTRERTARHRQP